MASSSSHPEYVNNNTNNNTQSSSKFLNIPAEIRDVIVSDGIRQRSLTPWRPYKLITMRRCGHNAIPGIKWIHPSWPYFTILSLGNPFSFTLEAYLVLMNMVQAYTMCFYVDYGHMLYILRKAKGNPHCHWMKKFLLLFKPSLEAWEYDLRCNLSGKGLQAGLILLQRQVYSEGSDVVVRWFRLYHGKPTVSDIIFSNEEYSSLKWELLRINGEDVENDRWLQGIVRCPPCQFAGDFPCGWFSQTLHALE